MSLMVTKTRHSSVYGDAMESKVRGSWCFALTVVRPKDASVWAFGTSATAA